MLSHNHHSPLSPPSREVEVGAAGCHQAATMAPEPPSSFEAHLAQSSSKSACHSPLISCSELSAISSAAVGIEKCLTDVLRISSAVGPAARMATRKPQPVAAAASSKLQSRSQSMRVGKKPVHLQQTLGCSIPPRAPSPLDAATEPCLALVADLGLTDAPAAMCSNDMYDDKSISPLSLSPETPRHTIGETLIPGLDPKDRASPRRKLRRSRRLVTSKSMPELSHYICPILSSKDVREFVPAQLRVLVAEDNVILQRIILKTLKNAGFSDVCIVGDGLRAIDAYLESCRALNHNDDNYKSSDDLSRPQSPWDDAAEQPHASDSAADDTECHSPLSMRKVRTTFDSPSPSPSPSAVNPDKFDVVLMDIHMPSANGIQACRAIRAHEEAMSLPRCPIIAFTSDADDIELSMKCRAAGMDDVVLKKPCTPAILSDVIKRAVCPAAGFS